MFEEFATRLGLGGLLVLIGIVVFFVWRLERAHDRLEARVFELESKLARRERMEP